MGNQQNSCCQGKQGRSDKLIQRQLNRIHGTLKDKNVNKRLSEVDFFVLDNSIRQSTVGALRGHTLQNKLQIYNEVKKCGFKHLIVCAFSMTTRVDDYFVKYISQNTNDFNQYYLYGFSQINVGIKDGQMITNDKPLALKKMKQRGLNNPIFEIDLNDNHLDWNGNFSVDKAYQIILDLMDYTRNNLSKDSNIFINLRDFSIAMDQNPKRVLTFVTKISSLPKQKRPFGFLYEDATGKYLPSQLGAWTKAVRKIMQSYGWKNGRLLVHIHQKWGYSGNIQLQCIINGADGVWASVCQQGAALGHASSSLTLMNLVRFGNKKILQKYNCNYLRAASRNVTKITSGHQPYPRQPISGQRALDLVFGFGGIAGGDDFSDFNLSQFFGQKPLIRINTLSTDDQIIKRLKEIFGDSSQFTKQMATKMHSRMIQDMKENRKEQYMSEIGLALLFDRSGGQLTMNMQQALKHSQLKASHGQYLIKQVRSIWDQWDRRESQMKDDRLQFDSFYHAFMQPYFGCFRCEDTRQGLNVIDMDDNGFIEWNEFCVYLKWALNQYGNQIKNIDQLLKVAFMKGIIPSMQDQLMKNRKQTILYRFQKSIIPESLRGNMNTNLFNKSKKNMEQS